MNEYKHSSNLQIKSLLPLEEKVRMRGSLHSMFTLTPALSPQGRGRTWVHRIFTRGFTLIELLVVVLIIGILAALGYPQYLLTVETSKARDAVALVTAAGTAVRMYEMDYPSCSGKNFTSSKVTDGCTGCFGSCTACDLVGCGYLASDNYSEKPYELLVGYNTYETTSGQPAVAYVQRQNCSNATYSGWGYNMDVNGGLTPNQGSPPPPQ
jgi:prepilin-type N-terminal cleavage/methylation domain-containing protein